MRREYIVGSIVLLVIAVASALVWNTAIRSPFARVTIATGAPAGTYEHLAAEFGNAQVQMNHCLNEVRVKKKKLAKREAEED